MLYLIGYDVNTTGVGGNKRLNKVAKLCCNYGQRVQNSLFECSLSGAQYTIFKAELLKLINLDEDSIRIYNLGKNYSGAIEHYGVKESYNPEGDLLF